MITVTIPPNSPTTKDITAYHGDSINIDLYVLDPAGNLFQDESLAPLLDIYSAGLQYTPINVVPGIISFFVEMDSFLDRGSHQYRIIVESRPLRYTLLTGDIHIIPSKSW